MFEPILASCLGGEAVGSTNSPVKRLDEEGKPKATGRQIDCYIGAENLAYEFKIRVTIAASGQGRFGEELSFPKPSSIHFLGVKTDNGTVSVSNDGSSEEDNGETEDTDSRGEKIIRIEGYTILFNKKINLMPVELIPLTNN